MKSGMAARTPFEEMVREALAALESAIAAGRPPEPNPALRTALAQVDALTRQMPADVDPQLRHYLQRGSLQKAARWLDGVRDDDAVPPGSNPVQP